MPISLDRLKKATPKAQKDTDNINKAKTVLSYFALSLIISKLKYDVIKDTVNSTMFL